MRESLLPATVVSRTNVVRPGLENSLHTAWVTSRLGRGKIRYQPSRAIWVQAPGALGAPCVAHANNRPSPTTPPAPPPSPGRHAHLIARRRYLGRPGEVFGAGGKPGRRPSGLNPQDLIKPSWPRSTRTSVPLAASYSRTVPSRPPETTSTGQRKWRLHCG